jgi:hypothetical protein
MIGTRRVTLTCRGLPTPDRRRPRASRKPPRGYGRACVESRQRRSMRRSARPSTRRSFGSSWSCGSTSSPTSPSTGRHSSKRSSPDIWRYWWARTGKSADRTRSTFGGSLCAGSSRPCGSPSCTGRRRVERRGRYGGRGRTLGRRCRGRTPAGDHDQGDGRYDDGDVTRERPANTRVPESRSRSPIARVHRPMVRPARPRRGPIGTRHTFIGPRRHAHTRRLARTPDTHWLRSWVLTSVAIPRLDP